MADESKGIAGRGLGFLNAQGILNKSKEDSKSENAGNTKTINIELGVSTSISDKNNDALGKIEARFIERANKAIELSASAENDIKSAHDIVTREISTAKELKKAINDGNGEEADKLRASLSDLQSERKALATSISQNNKDTTTDRKQTLSLGNSDNGTVTINEVTFSPRDDLNPSKIQSESDVSAIIEQLQSDRKDIRSQAQDLHSSNQDIQQALKDVHQELSQIRQDTIHTFDDAATVTDKVASEIKAGGLSALEATISKSLTSNVVQGLLNAA